MNSYPHFSDFSNISGALIGFVRFARSEGLNIGIQETKDAIVAAKKGSLNDRIFLEYSLKALFCTSLEEIQLFKKIFEQFWGAKKRTVSNRTTYRNRSNLQKRTQGSLVWMGIGDAGQESREEGKNVSGANRSERLRQTDFSKIASIENDLLEELALKLWRQLSLRIKRKMKAAATRGMVDIRKTIRKNIQHGGEPLELRYKKRLPRRHRLIILLDVSGSMDKYSFFLLRFIWALRAHFEKVEAFIFSTKLIRITDFLDAKNLESTLNIMSARANNWSGGTKIGACFQRFNESYAKRVLNGKSTLIILSDGLDTGEPDLLSGELNKIKKRTSHLIWLNPLKGMAGYEPIAKGMSAALPEIDVFQPAHNLNSLLELEKYLSYV